MAGMIHHRVIDDVCAATVEWGISMSRVFMAVIF